MPPHDLHEFLRSRRSVRRFIPRPVEREKVERILATAGYAPSAHGRQPWRFAILEADSPKALLAEAMGRDFHRDLARDNLPPKEIEKRLERSYNRITQAPVVIILSADITEMDSYPDEKRQAAETTMAVQSTAAAGLQLMLAAHAEGLASVWTCAPLFAPQTIVQTLNLPAHWMPQAMVFIGYPAEEPKPKTLKPLAEITRFLQ